jgi:hypothetical protein
MRYAIGLGAVLLLVGALFVWFRGASRELEVTEDELDASSTSAEVQPADVDVEPADAVVPVR